MLNRFDRLLEQSPDPVTASMRLEQLLQHEVVQQQIDDMEEKDLVIFINLIAFSNFLYRYLYRHPESIHQIKEPVRLEYADLDNISDLKGLLSFKYRELLKLSWQDLEGRLPYEEILKRLSILADRIICKTLELVVAGKPYPDYTRHKIPFCVIALGKLGACELNYSSDVDLVFVCADKDELGDDVLNYQTIINEQIRQFNHIMQEISEEGFLYRIDLRLRPWGKSGPLVLSVDETELYYEACTEAWERFAWLRARVITGDQSLGDELISRLQPFIYRRTLGSDDLKRFLQIKRDMARKRKRLGNWNVKLGEGGIRDIEFFLQMLQIVNSHQNPVLKTTNTLSLLSVLTDKGFLLQEQCKEIKESYLFLRRLENHLQMMEERQVHHLPENTDERIKIASSMGFGPGNSQSTVNNFNEKLNYHRGEARACFERILPVKSAFSSEISGGIESAWNRDTAESSMDRWLTLCQKEGWGRCPDHLELLSNVFGSSWYFSRFIFYRGQEVTHYFDQPLPDNYPVDPLRDWLLQNLQGNDLEQQFEILRVHKNEFMLQVFLGWLTCKYDQQTTEIALTNLAEATLSAAMQLLINEYDYAKEEIAILSMGRMAGQEMNFGSDLDLIFLYEGKSQEEARQMTRQIQSLLRHIATLSPGGILYEIDMRLRPHGTSGTLISPAPYFIEYHTAEREIWERQMMTRCRPVIDIDHLASQSLATVNTEIYSKYVEDHLKKEIRNMRKLVQDELGNPKGKYEIKRGTGGLMDIDFLTHYFQLYFGHLNEKLQTASTRTALRQSVEAGILDQTDGKLLLESYDYLKRIEACLRVTDMKSVSSFPRNIDDVKILSRGMGYLGTDADRAAEEFLAAYVSTTGKVREIFTRYVGNPTQ